MRNGQGGLGGDLDAGCYAPDPPANLVKPPSPSNFLHPLHSNRKIKALIYLPNQMKRRMMATSIHGRNFFKALAKDAFHGGESG